MNRVSAPDTYVRIRKLMEDQNSKVEDFCELLSNDSQLTSAILKIVNNEFFGFSGKIETIGRAVNLLGIGLLYESVLGLSEMECAQPWYRAKNQPLSQTRKGSFSEHKF
jgi:HD-like signal output (HDOD) protein